MSQDPDVDEKMGSLLNAFPRTTGPARLRHTFQVTNRPDEGLIVFNDCRRLSTDEDPHGNLAALVAGVNRAVIEDLSKFAVHAGVVQLGETLVAFPASSGQGKTTLTAACLLTGFAYVSDEALVLDDNGVVVPYPKPLAMSTWACEMLDLASDGDETLMTGPGLGTTTGPGGATVSDIVLTSYGAQNETLIELPRSEGVAALISHSFNHYKDPERAFRLATSTAARAAVWKLEYDHPLPAAELLMDKLG